MNCVVSAEKRTQPSLPTRHGSLGHLAQPTWGTLFLSPSVLQRDRVNMLRLVFREVSVEWALLESVGMRRPPMRFDSAGCCCVPPIPWFVGLIGVEDVWNFDCTGRQMFPTGRNEKRFDPVCALETTPRVACPLL